MRIHQLLAVVLCLTPLATVLTFQHIWGHRLRSLSRAQRCTRWSPSRLPIVRRCGFSDDIFGDDVMPSPEKSKSADFKHKSWVVEPSDADDEEESGVDKSLFQNVTWDAERGLLENQTTIDPDVQRLPVYALMYKFRVDFNEEESRPLLDNQKSYCSSFKRLVNNDIVSLDEGKGMVLLWTGLKSDKDAEKEQDDTYKEIQQFLEEDPLIRADVIESSEIIDLTKMPSEEEINQKFGEEE